MNAQDLGWCHHCETLQRLEDAPVLWVGYLGKEVACCAICREDEPWEFGVWDATKWVPELFCMPCLIRACAERWSGYPGDVRCEHAAGEIVWGAAIVHRKANALGHVRRGGHAERGHVDAVEEVPLRLLDRGYYDGVVVKRELRNEFVLLCQICFRGRAQHAVRWVGPGQGETATS